MIMAMNARGGVPAGAFRGGATAGAFRRCGFNGRIQVPGEPDCSSLTYCGSASDLLMGTVAQHAGAL